MPVNSFEFVHIWLGQFLPGSPDDFFEEQYDREADIPLSQYAASQEETWYDHDWVEIRFLDELASVRSLALGHSYCESYVEAVAAKAAALGIEQVNAFVLADTEQFAAPRSVRSFSFGIWGSSPVRLRERLFGLGSPPRLTHRLALCFPAQRQIS